MNLRDHDQPCEHDGNHHVGVDAYEWGGVWFCSGRGCPGGREVVIDYEAAVAEMGRQGWTYEYHEPDSDCTVCVELRRRSVRGIIAAALGIQP